MGWLFMPRTSMRGHATPKAYLDAIFTCEQEQPDGSMRAQKVLASACLGNRVYYAAAQDLLNGVAGDIFALVCLVRWNPRSATGEHFGYKDMNERMGPHEAECPASVLDLLTPTDSEYANDWRQRCRDNLSRRKRSVATGDRIKFPHRLKFTDGHEGDEFIVDRIGRRIILRDPETRMPYRVKGFMSEAWSLVPVTKVHRTVFL